MTESSASNTPKPTPTSIEILREALIPSDYFEPGITAEMRRQRKAMAEAALSELEGLRALYRRPVMVDNSVFMHDGDIRKIEAENDTLRAEVAALTKKLEEAVVTIQDMDGEIDALEDDKQSLCLRLGTAEAERKLLRAQVLTGVYDHAPKGVSIIKTEILTALHESRDAAESRATALAARVEALEGNIEDMLQNPGDEYVIDRAQTAIDSTPAADLAAKQAAEAPLYCAAVSGLWYHQPAAAGEVSAIRHGGLTFTVSTPERDDRIRRETAERIFQWGRRVSDLNQSWGFTNIYHAAGIAPKEG